MKNRPLVGAGSPIEPLRTGLLLDRPSRRLRLQTVRSRSPHGRLGRKSPVLARLVLDLRRVRPRVAGGRGGLGLPAVTLLLLLDLDGDGLNAVGEGSGLGRADHATGLTALLELERDGPRVS